MVQANVGSISLSILVLMKKSIKALNAARFTVLQRLCSSICRPLIPESQLES